MRSSTWLVPCIAGVLICALTHFAKAELPESYLKRWNDPVAQKRIDDGIERNRKSDAVLAIVDAAGNPLANADVKIMQKSHEFLFGCNMFVINQMNEKDAAYEEAFLRLFNFGTIAFYWDDLEPEPGKLRFTEGSPHVWRRPPPDPVVAFGKEHGLILKGHPLLWHLPAHNPQWMPKDPEELKRRYVQRFREIAERYAEDIPIWDGVNESLITLEEYPLYSEDVDYPPYVPWAFTEQQKLFRPENLLMINDVTRFNWPSDETNRYYRQCRRLLEDGVPIEGIGFQFHCFSRKELNRYLEGDSCDPNALLDTYARFAELGLPLWITEITLGSAGDDGLAIQERVTRDIYRLWFSAPKMAGITWWNLGDGTSEGKGTAKGGLTDEDFYPKPAYKALDQLINHDWKTKLEAKSTADGQVDFRGFHGDYSVDVTHGGKTRQFQLTISPEGTARATLTMP